LPTKALPGTSPPPAARAVLLSGEHDTLPLAELRALLAVHDPRATVLASGRVAVVQPGREEHTDAALARLALAHEWGVLWGQAPETPAGLETLSVLAQRMADGQGSIAVATTRTGAGKAVDRVAVERAVGAALKAAGHSIDLKAPARTVFAWAGEGRLVAGQRLGVIDRSVFETRCSFDRAHFSPVSLHPRRAASLLHLARVAPGGRVYDPFCGTGAFVLEAALEGYDAYGSDLDSFMVQGTLQTLADVGPKPLAGVMFVADIGEAPRFMDPVDGIVTDLPYGRASGTEGEGLRSLYQRAFAAFAQLLRPGGRAVIGHPDAALLDGIEAHGLLVEERHAEQVHRSLTRHYAVVIKV
jgi:tRNA (guanine10-N2)-dimethyltransferase